MTRALVALLCLSSFTAVAQDAGVVLTPGFDAVVTPWGPGRKSSGERFHSAAEAPGDGPLRWSWNDLSLAVGAQYFARGELRDNADLTTAARDFTLGFDQRARLSVRHVIKKGVVLIGFHERKSRYIADMTVCPVLPAPYSCMFATPTITAPASRSAR